MDGWRDADGVEGWKERGGDREMEGGIAEGQKNRERDGRLLEK